MSAERVTGYIVFGHGSTVESANESVRAMARGMAERGRYRHVETAFLEGGKPELSDAVDRLTAAGVDHIIVIPYFLTLGTHLKRDLPKLAEDARALNPGIEIEITPPLDGHPALADALFGRAQEAAKEPTKADARAGQTG